MQGLRETTDDTLRAAYHAGVTYWKKNKPQTTLNLETVARINGWHGADTTAWLAGFFNAKLSARM